MTNPEEKTNETQHNEPDTGSFSDMDHMSPDYWTGWGRNAVDLRIIMAKNISNFPRGLTNKEAHIQVRAAREQLLALNPDDRIKFYSLLEENPDSPWLNKLLEPLGAGLPNRDSDSDADRFFELIERRDEKGKSVIPTETLQNILEWHNHALAEKQKELDALSDELLHDYSESIEKAVEVGWLPTIALDRLQLLKHTNIVVDDGLATTLNRKNGQAFPIEGRYHNRRSTVVIAPGVASGIIKNHDTSTKEILPLVNLKILRHELTHRISGGTADTIEGGDSGGHYLTGLSVLFKRPCEALIQLNEALTEEIAHNLTFWYTPVEIDPHEANIQRSMARGMGKGDPAANELLRYLCGSGDAPTSQKDLYSLYFLDRNTTDPSIDITAIAARIKSLFPEDFFEKLSTMDAGQIKKLTSPYPGFMEYPDIAHLLKASRIAEGIVYNESKN